MNSLISSALAALVFAGATLAQEESKRTPPAGPPKGVEQDPKPDPKPVPKPVPDGEEEPLVLEVGATVPAETALRDLEGKPFTFEGARGKTVVIHFWSISCPSEKAAEPKLMKLAEDFAEEKVIVIGINANQNEIGAEPAPEDFEAEQPEDRPYAAMRAKAAAVKFNHRILIDHGAEVARLFAARTTPHCFVVDPKGVLVYSGALDDDPRGRGEVKSPFVHAAVEAVLAEREVETAKTRPYG